MHVLRVPSGRTFILDAGTRGGYDMCSQTLIPFLRSQRLPDPTAAFVSHPNTDHYNALPAYVSRHDLPRVYLNNQFVSQADGADTSQAAAEFAALLGRRGVEVVQLAAGERVRLDDRTSVEVAWPPADRLALGANESSLVLKVTCDGRSVLLPGDIEVLAQKELAAAGAIAADALVLPHHGAWRPSLPALVAAVGPSCILASSAREPYGPVDQLEPRAFYDHLHAGYRYYSTPCNGWIQFRFGREGIEVKTMR